jgi:hypothetical protein
MQDKNDKKDGHTVELFFYNLVNSAAKLVHFGQQSVQFTDYLPYLSVVVHQMVIQKLNGLI